MSVKNKEISIVSQSNTEEILESMLVDKQQDLFECFVKFGKLEGERFVSWSWNQLLEMVNITSQILQLEFLIECPQFLRPRPDRIYILEKLKAKSLSRGEFLRSEIELIAPHRRDWSIEQYFGERRDYLEQTLAVPFEMWKIACDNINDYLDRLEDDHEEDSECYVEHPVVMDVHKQVIDMSEKIIKKPTEIHALVSLFPLLGGVRRGGRRFGGRRRVRGRKVFGFSGGRRRGRKGGGFGPRQTVIDGGSTIRKALGGLRNNVRIPRLEYMCDSVLVDFIFHDAVLSHTNNGVAVCTWTYAINDLEDVTPSGNDVIIGTTAWSTFFSTYKVLKVTYSIDISNQETDGVTVLAWPSLTDLGVNYASASLMCGSPHVTQGYVSGKGGNDRTRLKGSFDLGVLTGNQMDYIANPDWGGTMVGNATNNVWLNVGGVSAVTFNTGAGLDYRATLVFTTLLKGRKNLAN